MEGLVALLFGAVAFVALVGPALLPPTRDQRAKIIADLLDPPPPVHVRIWRAVCRRRRH